jgi:hypothetical protein
VTAIQSAIEDTRPPSNTNLIHETTQCPIRLIEL